ncbi:MULTISPECIES: hypothetical protein [Flavobacteriaceae]|uniref:hypothetical protein n=1 Tax=Flavobacteriaceae TaxID=49546 RepID=UPI0010AE871B|nr:MULTISPECIES: hypothetical protein [Flavobacteriaceae]NJB36004.1 hypothetical protein [Croceivirga sp. JEA036]TKD59227.1 hypothetical protein FBT53_13475 [Flavobacterium sp. ASW18X]
MADQTDNPFKQLNRNLREVPPEMRKKVMNDIAIAKLILDMAVLVSSNYASVISGMIRTNKRK